MALIVTRTAAETSAALRHWREHGETVGFVPTMGALHEGHASLIRRAVEECDHVAVSVFVNPLQFGEGEDFAAYPRDETADAECAVGAGADLLFAPSVEAVYPEGFPPAHLLDPGPVGDILEGASRLGHFAGMLTVVDRLFLLAGPSRMYFGEKDAQQLFLVRRLASDRHPDISVVGCPIVREADGLAMSSRNTYLTAEERAAAPVLSRALAAVATLAGSGERNSARLRATATATIAEEPLAQLDYVEIVDEDFVPVAADLRDGGRYLTLLAVKIGIPRLLDNEALIA